MKKSLLILSAIIISISASSQVFNTSKTLKEGTFAVGIQPMIMTKGGSDFILFGHFGYGIMSGMDVSVKVGVLSPGSSYFGADVEFSIIEHLSFSGGAHIWGDFGLDFTALGSFPLLEGVELYGGVDVDMDFGNSNVYLPLWIPIGVEILIDKNIAVLLEASIGATNSAPHLISGGVSAYF